LLFFVAAGGVKMEQILFQARNIQGILMYLHEGMFIADKNKVITQWNPGAEKITGYLSADVVGKYCCENFLMHVDQNGENLCNEVCPLTASLTKGEICEAEVYLHHREGHRVPVSVRTLPIYDFQNDIIGVVELFCDNSPRESLAKELADLKDLATIDSLTGLRNRRYAEIIINSKLNELQAGGLSFGVLFIDIDHFKNINDTFGHDIGDLVLKMIAKTLINNTREYDVLVRWGGEEIVAIIVSPNIESKLYKIAEKLRHLIRQSILPMEDGTIIQVTVSIGATVAVLSDTLDTLVKRADQLMYQCKNNGRNCVKVEV
jgi:diguanylate cyclase (GGDEF)-like protein/PAS domain S-box-containing protein